MSATTSTDGTTGYPWYLGQPRPSGAPSATSQAARRTPFGEDTAAQRRMRGA